MKLFSRNRKEEAKIKRFQSLILPKVNKRQTEHQPERKIIKPQSQQHNRQHLEGCAKDFVCACYFFRAAIGLQTGQQNQFCGHGTGCRTLKRDCGPNTENDGINPTQIRTHLGSVNVEPRSGTTLTFK